MIEACRRGYDVVYAPAANAGAETVTNALRARFFYFLIEKLSGTPIPHNTGDFRLITRRALTELLRLRETHRFLRGWCRGLVFPKRRFFTTVPAVSPVRHISRFEKCCGLHSTASCPCPPCRCDWRMCCQLLLFRHFCQLHRLRLLQPLLSCGRVGARLDFHHVGHHDFRHIQLLLFGVFGEYLGRIMRQSKKPARSSSSRISCRLKPKSRWLRSKINALFPAQYKPDAAGAYSHPGRRRLSLLVCHADRAGGRRSLLLVVVETSGGFVSGTKARPLRGPSRWERKCWRHRVRIRFLPCC